jgi:hypothetical protein
MAASASSGARRHGKTVAPALEARLKAKYPNELARGYALGEFRGVFWAEVKK